MVFFFFRTGWGLNKGPTSQAIMGSNLLNQCFVGLLVRGIQVMHYPRLDKQRGRNGWHFVVKPNPWLRNQCIQSHAFWKYTS